MKCSSVWMLLAVFLFFPLGLCIAEGDIAQPPQSSIKAAGLGEDIFTGEKNITITAAESAETKWQRDVVMPKLPQLLNDKRLEKFYATGALDPVKKILAQANVSQANPAAKASPQIQGDKLGLTLNQSLEIALKNNLDIRIAELTKDAVQTTVPRAQAQFHPTVGYAFTGFGAKDVVEREPNTNSNAQDGTVFINQPLPTGTGATVLLSSRLLRTKVDSQTYFSDLGVTIVQPLFRGGGFVVATRQISDAKSDVRIEGARLIREILDVAAQTKSAYYNVLLAEKVIGVTEEAIERDKTLLEASQALLDAGFVTKRDVFSAELSLAKDSANLVSVQADLESAKNRLLEVLGLSIGTNVVLLDKDITLQPVQTTLAAWIARAIKDRPEILELEEQQAKSALNVRVAKNTVLPQVDLIGSYNKAQTASTLSRATDFRGRAWSVGVLVSYPIWNVAAKSDLAKAEIEQGRLEEILRRTKRQIELEVRASVIKINKSLERIRPLTISLDQAKGKLEISKARFALGQTTNFDITDAQGDIVNAETGLLRAIVDYNIGLAELEARIAGTL